MSDPTPPFTRVRRHWEVYDYDEVSRCLEKTRREFGQHSKQGRWYFKAEWPYDVYDKKESCNMDFFFRDPHDAMIFALKYLS
jgi:hypothetical protein